MKKLWIFLVILLGIALVVALVIGIHTHVQNVQKEQKVALRQAIAEQMMQHCDKETEKLYNDKLYRVCSVDYNILDVEEKPGGYMSYNISVEWHVQADEFVNKETDEDYWVTKIKTTDPHMLFVDGEMYSIYTTISLIYNDTRLIASVAAPGTTNTGNTGYREVHCSYCGQSFRATSSYGRRVQNGMPCGFRGCGK